MPLGWIAAELLRLRAALLGPTLSCLANCPRCDTVVESQIGIAQLTGAAGVSSGAESPSRHRLKAAIETAQLLFIHTTVAFAQLHASLRDGVVYLAHLNRSMPRPTQRFLQSY